MNEEDAFQLPENLVPSLLELIDMVKPMLTDEQRARLSTEAAQLATQVINDDPDDDALYPLLKLAIALWSVMEVQKTDEPMEVRGLPS